MDKTILRHLARTEAMMHVLIETYAAMLSKLEGEDFETVKRAYAAKIASKEDEVYGRLLKDLGK